MGRKARTSTGPASTITLRLSPEELILLDELTHQHGLHTRSDLLRLGMRSLAGSVITPKVSASHLVERLSRRKDDLAIERIQEGETLLLASELEACSAEEIETMLLPAVRLLIQTHVQMYGWFYPTCSESVADILQSVRANAKGPPYSGISRTGVDFLRARFRSFWSTYRGPVDSTEDPARLSSVLRHLLGLSTARKPWNITLQVLRRGFFLQHMTVSFFRPCVAASIYRKWTGDIQKPRVWDPSAGFGARMLGFFSMYPDGIYCANEPAKLTFTDLESLGGEMPGAVELTKQGSEFASFEPDSLDLVFTSPPYFSTEKYFNEPGQCWVEYPTVESWREKQVIPTLKAAFSGLKSQGHAIFNINQAHRDTFLLVARDVGFEPVKEEVLVLRRDPLAQGKRFRKDPAATKSEPILVFRKP